MNEENHELFKAHLKASREAVWIIAKWLNSRGNNVKVNTSSVAPTHADWKQYVDNGDLEVSLRVEVKQLSYQFTCRDDWPFGENFIVCAQQMFDNACPKPFAFFYVNPKATHVAQVLSSSSKTWTVGTFSDRRYKDHSQTSYYCPLAHVRFYSIT